MKNTVSYTQPGKFPGVISSEYATDGDGVKTIAIAAGNNNNLAIGDKGVILLTAVSGGVITGLAAPNVYKKVTLVNTSVETISFDADAVSTAANRFMAGTDYTLLAGRSVDVIYSVSSARWSILATNPAP